MDREEQLTTVVEAFQRLRYGDVFSIGMGGWVDEVFDAGFNLLDVPFGDLQTELEGCQVQTLMEIANGLYDYLRLTPAHGDQENGAKDTNILTVLEKAEVPLKELMAALTAFIYTGIKSKRSDGVATRGCAAAAIFLLLCTATRGNIPASLHNGLGISTLFIAPLYTKSVDILALPDSWETKKATGKKGRPLTERQANGIDDFEEMDLFVDTNVQWEEAQPVLLKALVLLARNIDLDSFPFHLGRPCRLLANIWKKDFPEEKIPAFDASPNLDNLINRSHYVFKWFSLVLSERQKNLPENLEVVFWALEPSVLRLSETLCSYQTVTKPVETFAGKVTQYCLALIEKFSENEDCIDVIERFLQDLFYNVPDTAEYRRRLAETFVGFVDVLKPSARNSIIRWIAEEADADRARGRTFALNVMQVLWTRNWDDVSVPYLKCTSRQAVVLEVCLRRLPDKSAKIRGCAASVMSSLLESDPDVFDLLVGHQDDQPNGPQAPNRLDSLFSTVLSGISDISVISRKAYLQMLGRLLISNFQRFDQEVKEAVLRVAQDPAKTMRTCNVQIISSLVATQPASDALIDLWIRGLFHLYMDSEQTVKDSVSEAFQKAICNPILKGDGGEQAEKLAWRLLQKICKDELGEIRLLRQMLHDLEKAKVLTTGSFSKLQEFFGTEHGEIAWILLAELASILKNPSTDFAFNFVEGRTFEGEDDTNGACVFRVIQAGFSSTVKDAEQQLALLQEAFPQIKGVATIVEAVRAILAAFEKTASVKQFNQWAEEHHYQASKRLEALMTEYEDWLRYQRNAPDQSAINNSEINQLEADLSFSVRLVAELGKHLGLGKDRKRDQPDYVAIRDANATLALLEKMCDFENHLGCRPWVRAHAVFALGRVCLGAKPLTWKFSSKIIDLANSHQADIGLRRDGIVVVFDLLKMFGDVVEKDLSKVYRWLGDRCSAIRGDVINHLHDLLLNEHLQWNPAVFYQFLTSISDPNPTIREWVRSCLRSLMKKRNQCFTDFSEAIVFLNGCTEHPRFRITEKLSSQGMDFPLGGRKKIDKRLEVYSFMLKQMTDEQKRLTYARVLEQILMPVVSREVQIEVHRYYRDVLLDVVRILGMKEMEFSVFIKNTEEDENEEEVGDEDGDAEQMEDEALRKEQKQSKAVRKEIWIKFRQEIVQRSLLPVLGSVYRQIRNIPDAPDLLAAVVRLVDSLTKEAEIDLAELAQSTCGFDGQILKALAMDIKRFQEVSGPPSNRSPSPERPGTPEADDVPLIRASPTNFSENVASGPTPSLRGDRVTDGEDAVSSIGSQPPSPKKPRNGTTNGGWGCTDATAKSSNKVHQVKVEDVEEEQEDGPQRKSRRVASRGNSVANESTSSGWADDSSSEKAVKKGRSLRSDRTLSPPAKRTATARVKKPKSVMKPDTMKKEIPTQKATDVPPGRRTTRTKRLTFQEHGLQEESDNDTLTELKVPAAVGRKSRSQKVTPAEQTQSHLTMGPPRAISTPNKTRNAMNVTFDADISCIDAGGASQRTLRSGIKSRGLKK